MVWTTITALSWSSRLQVHPRRFPDPDPTEEGLPHNDPDPCALDTLIFSLFDEPFAAALYGWRCLRGM